MTKKTLLIIWHSRTGASQQLAQAAWRGAQEAFAALEVADSHQAQLQSAMATTPHQLRQASAYIFCAPENLASLSGEMKAFFDRCYYAVLDQLNGRPYGAIISAGSDGQQALKQMERICTGWRLEAAWPAYVCMLGAQTAEQIWAPKLLNDEQLAPAYELGSNLAGLLALH